MMLRLAARTLRLRLAAFAASLVAILVGAVVVIACAGLMETGVRFDVPPQRLAGAPVVVSGDHDAPVPGGSSGSTLPERVRPAPDVTGLVAAVPGVERVVADVGVPLVPVRDGTVSAAPTTGRSWATADLLPYRLAAGAAPTAAGDVVLDRSMADAVGVAVGGAVDLGARGTTSSYRVTGIVDPASATTGTTVFLAPPDLTRLAPPGGPDAIAVLPTAGTDPQALAARITEAVAGRNAVVHVGDDRGLAEFPQAPAQELGLIVVAAVFGGMAVVVALFGTASMLTLAVQQRHREMALLRAVGAVPRQLRRMVLAETMLLAVVATLAAVVPGRALGGWLFGRLAEGGLAPQAAALRQSWVGTSVAVLVALAAAAGAAFVAGRRTADARPVEALAEADLQRRWFSRRRLVGAVLCFWVGAALLVVTATVMRGPVTAATAGPAVLWFAFGVALLGPGIARALVHAVAPLLRRSGTAGRHAGRNAAARPVRVAAVLTPVMLMVGFATADIYMGTTEVAVTADSYTRSLDADLVVDAGPAGLSPSAVERVRTTDGVAGVSRFVTSTGFVTTPSDPLQTDEGWPLQGVDPSGLPAADVVAGDPAALTGRTVALTTAHAAALGRSVGDTVTLRLGDGVPVDLRVVALLAGPATFDSVRVPADLLLAHTTTRTVTQLMVRATPGADTPALTSALERAVGDVPGARVVDRDVLGEVYGETIGVQALAIFLAVGVIVAYTVIVAVNTIATATIRRRAEFALQRLVGATRGQVMRMMAAEAALTAALGALLGTVAAAAALAAFGVARSGSLLPTGPVWVYPALLAGALVTTMLATLVPTWAALRTPPVRAVAAAG